MGSVSHYPGRVRPLLPAVVAALVAPVLPVLAAAPAGAANDQDPRTIDKRTVYTCSSEVLGTGDFETFVRVQLPRTVTAGKKMAARPLDLSIVVPEDMTQAMRDYGVEEVSAKHQDGGRLVSQERCDYLRPTVVHCASPEAAMAKKEYMYPFVTVVECPQDKMIGAIGSTLVATGLTEDPAFTRALLDARNIDRLNIGPVPTIKLNWLQPHEGNIVDFLFRPRAFQRAS